MAKIEPKSLIDRLNPYCREALENATGLCLSRSHYEVTVDHALLKLVDSPQADLQNILRHFEVEPSRVIGALQHNVEGLRAGNTGKPVFSPLLFEWMKEAWMSGSLGLGEPLLRSGTLLLALLDNPARYLVGGDLLELSVIDPVALLKQFGDIVAASTESTRKGAAPGAAPGTREAAPTGEGALGRFCIDFTQRAKAGEIDPVFGRDREIRQMVDILARRRKNNPIVVGEPGVGKTAVVEGLALRIAQGDVPSILADVSLLVLDLGLLQAGAGVKGEFENRLKQVISEVKASPKPIIMFIDEAHTLIGAGGQSGGSDAANLLKPALARGELRTIAATTWSEYKKYFEKDPALARRFQVVKLDEPSVADTIIMLRGLREKYEDAHGVQIPDAAMVAAAELSGRYISGRLLPDKAVDLLDTAAARVKIGLSSRPDALEDVDRLIQTLTRERDAHRRDLKARGNPDDDRIASLSAQIAEHGDRLKTLTDRWLAEKAVVDHYLALRSRLSNPDGDGKEGKTEPPPTPEELKRAIAATEAAQGKSPFIPLEVSADVIGKVVSDWTGIPVGNMVKDEAQTILTFDQHLKERIKGQDFAVAVVATGIRAAKAGVQDPSKPIGVFLFVGPSGVGKTETALGVADLLFGGERFITTVNMSEFQEKHTVSRLIGSPPGYVGFGEGGVLTEAVRQRPYSVVLLDEVEKADPEVMNLFYQVFDKGMLSDGEGREIDFKNTVIFLTSNLATDPITEMGMRDTPPTHEEVVSAIRPILNRHFKPALVGRMTIVPFFPLKTDAIKRIVVLKLKRVVDRLYQSHKMALEFDDVVVDQVAARCTEVETGARNIDH
ncbi:MAG: type VI secretion system ATPase TssH, partial [candidate division Zixibacteria bacterium]|nr:type VI secretion system ATPase TssH [candidate division Zixibacteria bacterium]